MKGWKGILKKVWYFIWEDDSIWSWIANIALAFILIKFIVYPSLGFLLHTSYPVVAVVSESMEHNSDFETWWARAGNWYASGNISKDEFESFPFNNGFNKGDIMVLLGKKPENIKIGDIIVFISDKQSPIQGPIIHRVVKKLQSDNSYNFQTKGDNNLRQIDSCSLSGCINELDISEQQIMGNAALRIPWLGYIKIWFVDSINIIKGAMTK